MCALKKTVTICDECTYILHLLTRQVANAQNFVDTTC